MDARLEGGRQTRHLPPGAKNPRAATAARRLNSESERHRPEKLDASKSSY
jgi:hypothetical protein